MAATTLPRRLRRLVLRGAVLLLALALTLALGFTLYAVGTLPPLQPWHTELMRQEFDADRHEDLDLAVMSRRDGCGRQGRRRHRMWNRPVDDGWLLYVAMFVVRLFVPMYVDVNGQNAGDLGTDERRDRNEERRTIAVEKLGLVHRRRLWFVVGCLARHGAHVDYDADKCNET